MKVDIYRNLNYGCLSVKSREPEVNYGRVVDHKNEVWVRDASFIVSEAGRQRVLRERRKNVHAVVRGSLVRATKTYDEDDLRAMGLDTPVEVTYNPYQFAKFVSVKGHRPILAAKLVHVTLKKLQRTVSLGV